MRTEDESYKLLSFTQDAFPRNEAENEFADHVSLILIHTNPITNQAIAECIKKNSSRQSEPRGSKRFV